VFFDFLFEVIDLHSLIVDFDRPVLHLVVIERLQCADVRRSGTQDIPSWFQERATDDIHPLLRPAGNDNVVDRDVVAATLTHPINQELTQGPVPAG